MENLIEEVSAEMLGSTKEAINDLIKIWTEIGYSNADIIEKVRNFQYKNLELYEGIISENTELKDKLSKKVDKLGAKYFGLIKMLKLSPHPIVKNETVSILELENVLKNEIFQLQKEIDDIQKEITELTDEEHKLSSELGITPIKLKTEMEMPTRDAINTYKERIAKLQNLHFERNEELCTLKEKISEIMKDIGHEPSSNISNQLFSNNVILSEENINRLKKWLDQLEQERSQIIEKHDGLRRDLQNLWDRLEENPKRQSDFLEKHQGYSPEVLEALQNEISRCRSKQKAISKTIVEKLRIEIQELWEKCLFGENQKKEFINFTSTFYSEDLIILHERYIDSLNSFYDVNENIYELINEHEQLWKEFIELNEKAGCVDRYKNRGGQLLKEEKRRKFVSNKLPKIENELKNALDTYEKENGNPFLIKDECVRDIIDEKWKVFNENKNIKSSARKCAQTTNTFLTPSSKSVLTPAVSRNRLTPAVSKSRLTPAVSKSRLTPAVSQSRLTPAVSQSRLTPAVSQSRLVPGTSKIPLNSATQQSSVGTSYARHTPNAKRKILVTPSADAKRAKMTIEIPKKISVKKVIGCKSIRKSLVAGTVKSNTNRRRSRNISVRKRQNLNELESSVNYNVFEADLPKKGRSTAVATIEEKENDDSIQIIECKTPIAKKMRDHSPRTPRNGPNTRLYPTLPLII